MKQLALIGSTASGKSDLALQLAHRYNGVILSIDSLSIYSKIDIASAKPTLAEREGIEHFGIDCLMPDQHANVITFIDEYHRACQDGRNVIIVGGSSFYLKSMIEGLSPLPTITDDVRKHVTSLLDDVAHAHALLAHVDPQSVRTITPHDRYRIEKLLLIHIATGRPPSEWFEHHPPIPILHKCPILHLDRERAYLRQRIAQRTTRMLHDGLIDEVAHLEQCYGRAPQSMKAIGIIETLAYLDGKLDRDALHTQITTHTAQLAKRQQTFNRNQFEISMVGDEKNLEHYVARMWG